MPKVIVSDTSCFIALAKIGAFEILKDLYQEIVTTTEVADEFGQKLPSWIILDTVKDLQKQHMLEIQVDKGEASAITLALELGADLIILDDFKARKVAQTLGLSVTGTLGIIVKAKKSGLIPSIKPILKKLQKTDFYLSKMVLKEALRLAGE